jgi:threonine synthase
MRAYGARLFRIRNFGVSPTATAEVMHGLKRLAVELDAGFEITAFVFSPRGMVGVQTIGYEIDEAFPNESFSVFSPAGGGGLTLAVARGVEQRGSRGRVHCVQPLGNDTMSSSLRSGALEGRMVESKTVISGLQVGGVLDANEVIATCRRLGGQGYVVEDEAIFRWQQRMAREEGVFSEPAGAVALAGVEQAVSRGEVAANENIVCLVTGSGFKDERALARMAGETETPLLENFAEFSSRVRG